MKHGSLADTSCAIARSVAVLGERWTFVILRQAFMGARRFEDYSQGTGIARNILTERLRTLVEHGILERRPYAQHATRTLFEYRLTQKGLDLYPVMIGLMQWGNKHGGFDDGPPLELEHRTCGHMIEPRFTCPECGDVIDPRQMRPHAAQHAPA